MFLNVRFLAVPVLAGAVLAAAPQGAGAATILSGFDGSTLAANDDGSTGAVNIGYSLNFYGTDYSQLYVNNNGNVTFGSAYGTYTPYGLSSASIPIIAAFFADVNTNNGGSPVTYGTGAVDGHAAFGVNYVNVSGFGLNSELRDNFQIVLIDRSDTGTGNFDIEFNYGSMAWDTGTASGGVSAYAGYSNGSGTYAQLDGSGVTGAFLDGGAYALADGSNVGTPGRFLFSVRDGEVAPSAVPLPATLPLMAGALAGFGLLRRKRRG